MIFYWDYNIKNISENVHILPNSSQKLIIGHMGKIGLGQIVQNLCNFVNRALTKRTVGTLRENLYHQTGSSEWLEATTANTKNVQQWSRNAGNSLNRAGSGH